MDILSIYFQMWAQMWAKILRSWWPVIFSVIVGLAVLARLERREKNRKSKKTIQNLSNSHCRDRNRSFQ